MIRGNYKIIKHHRTCLLALLGILLCVFLLPFFGAAAYADDTQTTYSTVLDDLSKDSSFDVADYPNIDDDYSLQVIQIAESTNKELFVYAYQPAFCEFATSINISTASNGLEFMNYKLAFLSANATLYKYKVANFPVSEDSTRYYTITSIYRPFNEDYGDKQPGGDNTINEVSYAVGKTYTFEGEGKDVTCSVQDVELINIVDKYVGFVRYFGGNSYVFCLDSCDSYFVAFSTDKSIDKLLSADIFFKTQKAYYEDGLSGSLWDFYDINTNYAHVTEHDTAFYSSPSSTWQGYSYSWSRIQSIQDFFSTEDFSKVYKGSAFNQKVTNTLTDSAKKDMQNMQWVLRFYEASYEETRAPYPTKNFTIVSDVSLLKLTFETVGRVYDLGVVDNKQTGSDKPSNDQKIETTLPDWLKNLLRILFWIVVGILYIIKLLIFVVKYLAIAIWYILKYLALAIYWIFAWPFYLRKK